MNTRIKIDRRRWIAGLVLILFGLATGNTGCASTAPSTPIPSQLQALLGCDAANVTVTDVHWFRDSQGAWRVVGVINNNSTKPVSTLVTGVETYTKSGQPADQGEDVSAYPLNLQPGRQAPFTAWIDREIPSLDHFEVEVDDCILTEPAERTQVEVHGGQLTVDNSGFAEVTAELYNPNPTSVLVNGLMAAVYDQAGALVSADYVDVASRYLAPGEAGPVRATLDLPPDSAGQIKSYQFFMDTLVNEPAPLPIDLQQNVKLIARYTDESGHFHLVGQITNPGTQGLMTSLQATVYSDSTETTVVDAAQFDTWIPVQPGETLPFDITGWGALDNTPGLWEQLAGKDAAIQLRIEPFLTWTQASSVANLPLDNANIIIKDQQAIYTGMVKNDLSGSLINGLVTAVLSQKNDGQIVAVGSVHLDTADPVAPGRSLNYVLAVSLPPNVDPASLETNLFAMGQQP